MFLLFIFWQNLSLDVLINKVLIEKRALPENTTNIAFRTLKLVTKSISLFQSRLTSFFILLCFYKQQGFSTLRKFRMVSRIIVLNHKTNKNLPWSTFSPVIHPSHWRPRA